MREGVGTDLQQPTTLWKDILDNLALLTVPIDTVIFGSKQEDRQGIGCFYYLALSLCANQGKYAPTTEST